MYQTSNMKCLRTTFLKTANYVKSRENRWLTPRRLCFLGRACRGRFVSSSSTSISLFAELDSGMRSDPVLDRGIRKYVFGNGLRMGQNELLEITKSTPFHGFVASSRTCRRKQEFSFSLGYVSTWVPPTWRVLCTVVLDDFHRARVKFGSSIFFTKILYVVVQHRGACKVPGPVKHGDDPEKELNGTKQTIRLHSRGTRLHTWLASADQGRALSC